jgi:uncharacterized protein YgfB (UPF0149 family)
VQLVEYKDSHPGEIKHSYEQVYTHIRACVDLCHRDGVIKVRHHPPCAAGAPSI